MLWHIEKSAPFASRFRRVLARSFRHGYGVALADRRECHRALISHSVPFGASVGTSPTEGPEHDLSSVAPHLLLKVFRVPTQHHPLLHYLILSPQYDRTAQEMSVPLRNQPAHANNTDVTQMCMTVTARGMSAYFDLACVRSDVEGAKTQAGRG